MYVFERSAELLCIVSSQGTMADKTVSCQETEKKNAGNSKVATDLMHEGFESYSIGKVRLNN